MTSTNIDFDTIRGRFEAFVDKHALRQKYDAFVAEFLRRFWIIVAFLVASFAATKSKLLETTKVIRLKSSETMRVIQLKYSDTMRMVQATFDDHKIENTYGHHEHTNTRGRTHKGTALNISNCRFMLIGGIFALFVNNLLIGTSHQLYVEEFPEQNSKLDRVEFVTAPSRPLHMGDHLRNSRMLIGIFSADNIFDATHRKWHRNLINNVWKDDRMCTLNNFRRSNDTDFKKRCEIVYTFLTAASDDPNAPTQRLADTDTDETPIELKGGYKNPKKEDINYDDVTHLNIKDNMNDGKSETWFYFGAKMAKQFEHTETPIDYIMKFDSDSMLKLYDYLEFAHTRLPPAPYNKFIYGGALRDKAPWYFPGSNTGHPPEELDRYESFWGNEFDGIHLYLAGQCYFMSPDLADFVSHEAQYADKRVAKGGYLEHHEDHDIGSMVFHNPTPINLLSIGKTQRFWEHPVKGAPRYLRILEREKARMKQRPFEGKILKLY